MPAPSMIDQSQFSDAIQKEISTYVEQARQRPPDSDEVTHTVPGDARRGLRIFTLFQRSNTYRIVKTYVRRSSRHHKDVSASHRASPARRQSRSSRSRRKIWAFYSCLIYDRTHDSVFNRARPRPRSPARRRGRRRARRPKQRDSSCRRLLLQEPTRIRHRESESPCYRGRFRRLQPRSVNVVASRVARVVPGDEEGLAVRGGGDVVLIQRHCRDGDPRGIENLALRGYARCVDVGVGTASVLPSH